ncbi:MAG: DinB family protein [Planctomycetes bacterium]|nr:DinB family protein [Planctomycetota bacterium]
MTSLDPLADLTALGAAYAEIRAWLALPRERVLRVDPALSGWNVEQHVAHCSLANELVGRNLKSLLKGSGLLVVDTGEPVDGALEILASGRIPRGTAQAPRSVRPPPLVERAYLLEWLDGNEREFAEAKRQLDLLLAAPKRIPHQILGPLTAVQWLRFAAIHTAHHMSIARELL